MGAVGEVVYPLVRVGSQPAAVKVAYEPELHAALFAGTFALGYFVEERVDALVRGFEGVLVHRVFSMTANNALDVDNSLLLANGACFCASRARLIRSEERLGRHQLPP